MKTSIVLIILILFNTTALISEPLAFLVKGINTWVLLGIELLLLVVYYINQAIRDINKIVTIDFNNLKLFVVTNKTSK